MPANTALIVGALGVTGRALVEYLEDKPDWNIVALSRRAPDFPTRATFLSVDLTDADDCRAKLAEHREITYVFYTAYSQQASVAAEIPVNVGMLANLMDAVEKTANIRHVQLMHGAKWYGTYLGSYKTPAREDDPRPLPVNFYHAQQDWLEARHAAQSGWSWSALRPHGVWGFSTGSAMNLMTGIACYAAISKELGLPLRWPGNAGFYDRLYQLIDVDLLAEAMVWAATTPAAANEAFNITNGDLFRWRQLWPRIAEFFEMEIADPQPVPIAATMADKGELWERMVAEHGLRPYPLDEIVNWAYLDMALGTDMDAMSSLTKIFKAGWTNVWDSEATITRQLQKLRDRKIIP
ncbi:MAG: SDR family oxidoreductase [Alphaproteobacteria bacterium]